MSLANHLEELQRKHGDIERELDEAMLHPSVDDLEIVTLKRRKLALKDEIEKLKARLRSGSGAHRGKSEESGPNND